MVTIHQGKPCNALNYSSRGGAKIQYIVIHYTAGNGDTAAGECNYFANGSRGASAHYFVGEDGIYQSVPDDLKAWHCGGTSIYKHPTCRNANSIGVEICSRRNASGEYYFVKSVVEQTIELTKHLMKKYNIPADRVIRHFDVWDKSCPAPFVKYPVQWQIFKQTISESEVDIPMTDRERANLSSVVSAVSKLSARVDALDKPKMIYNYVDDNMPDWARPTVQKLVGRGILQGNDKGELGLTDELLRILVINDRAGVYDR